MTYSSIILLALLPPTLAFVARSKLVRWLTRRYSAAAVTMMFTACIVGMGAQSLLGTVLAWPDDRERGRINEQLAAVQGQTEPIRKRISENAQATTAIGTLADAQARGPDAARAWHERKATLLKESSDIDAALAAIKQKLAGAQQSSDDLRKRSDTRNFWLLCLAGVFTAAALILGLAMRAMRNPP